MKELKKAMSEDLNCCVELFDIVKGAALVDDREEKHETLNDVLNRALSFYNKAV